MAGPAQGTSERGSASSQYDLLARLAAGGMAEIFLARANSLAGLERYVVLKRIRPERGDDARWVAMFLDEARLAAQLQHPNIAQVFDLGQIGDDYFYTMEYVHGEDVLDILSRTVELGQPMPVQVALSIIAGAAAGLAHAHERCAPDGRPLGIVHRDISPSNLMVSMEGTVKVVDFGVAKARFRSTETQAGTIMGKVAYLSPEQCTTGEIDHRSDIFSLGIVLYEMLTGTRLFKRETDYETLRSVARDHPMAPSTIVANLPRGLDAVVLRALAKDPDERYHTAHAMLDALEHVAEGAGMSITSNVLRRYMRDLFGMREEPWRELERAMIPMIEDSEIELIEEDSRPRVVHGLPADAKADAVPMLQQTGMIDLEALFGTQLTSRPRLSPAQPPIAIPTGSIVMVPLPVPDARHATNTSIVRVATGSADGIPYPVRRSVNTAAVRRPRSSTTVLITAGVLVGVVVIVYALFVQHPKPTATSVSGSAATPTVTHIDDPKIAVPATQPQPAQPQPAQPLPTQPLPTQPLPTQVAAPPVAPVTAPLKPSADPVKAALAKPADGQRGVVAEPGVPRQTGGQKGGADGQRGVVDKKPEPPKKVTPKCSDPLDCQY